MIVDEARVVRWANAAFERVLGYPPEALVGRDVFELIHPDDLPALGQTIGRLTGEPEATGTANFRMKSAEGSWRCLETSARNLLEDPAIQGFVISLRDVTERLRAEADYRASEERFRDLVEHARDAVYTADLHGSLTSANPATERLTGFARDELLTMNFFDLVAPEDRTRARQILARRVAGGGDEPVELRLLAKDGHTVYVDVVGRPIAPAGRAPSLIGIARDTTERHALEEKLRHQVLHDALTGLPNRTLFFDRLEQALSHATRSQSSVAVMLLDVDGFKLVNDRHGHGAGDQLLVELARRLRSVIRSGETAARLGGDEFALIIEGIRDDDRFVAIGERVLSTFDAPFTVDERELQVSGSLGVALRRMGATAGPNDLLREADTAMYRAKASGKGRFELFAPAI